MTVVQEFSSSHPSIRASEDAADRVAYARDCWPRHHLAVRAGNVGQYRPAGIVWPTSTTEVASIVRWAASTGTALVPFGAGSGVCAAILPTERMLVVDLKKMTRWRSFDGGQQVLDVESGHMGLPLEGALERRGLTLGHFPSSILCSTVGGWVAARSAGQCSSKYGKIEDMVLALECVTGTGEVVTFRSRTAGPSLVPLLVGSEGTLAVITSVTLRLHPKPVERALGAYTFASTSQGWEAMRTIMQKGLRPAVLRLYDPFDAMLARRGGRDKEEASAASGSKGNEADRVPGLGVRALRSALRYPRLMNSLLEGPAANALGGALLLFIYEGDQGVPAADAHATRQILEHLGGRYDGEAPAQRWLSHRYAVSYRQAPMFAQGMFVDTFEVAAPWSKLEELYESVRRALGNHVFVMAHLSHAYPDGCCIYFSFAGSASRGSGGGWDERCEEAYDAAWRAALAAAVRAGGTVAHHHGVGRSKAPRIADEIGHEGTQSFLALKRAFDPRGILNPGVLVEAAPRSSSTYACTVQA